MEKLGVFNALSPFIKELMYHLDAGTYSHCRYLSLQAKKFGIFLGLPEPDIDYLTWGAYFHDIGKAFIPQSILNKPTSLTPEEWDVIKLHPAIDNTILKLPPSMTAILPIIQSHHERWDGSGYPHGLAHEEIPYLARVVQILDIYDALTHTRSYKKTFSSEKAIAIIWDEMHNGWYQPSLVKQFVEFATQQEKLKLHPTVRRFYGVSSKLRVVD